MEEVSSNQILSEFDFDSSNSTETSKLFFGFHITIIWYNSCYKTLSCVNKQMIELISEFKTCFVQPQDFLKQANHYVYKKSLYANIFSSMQSSTKHQLMQTN